MWGGEEEGGQWHSGQRASPSGDIFAVQQVQAMTIHAALKHSLHSSRIVQPHCTATYAVTNDPLTVHSGKRSKGCWQETARLTRDKTTFPADDLVYTIKVLGTAARPAP